MLYSERNNWNKKPTFEVIKTLVYNTTNSIFLSTDWHWTRYTYEKQEVIDFFMEKTHEINFNVFLFERCVENDTELFDMIEVIILFLYTKVNEDTQFWRYGWWEQTNCGKFIKRMNTVLLSYGYTINEKGEVEKVPDEWMTELVEEENKTEEPERFEKKIEEAKKIFFWRNGWIEAKKSACEKLAQVIEYVRDDINWELRTETESLMKTVNETDIRHSKKGKRLLEAGNKDDENFVDWVFYSLINCINFYLKSNNKK